jgi:hypothetical protein
MANEPNNSGDILPPEDADVVSASPSTPEAADVDPADDIPVPIAMSPAEIDERAQAVDAVRRNTVRDNADLEPRVDI